MLLPLPSAGADDGLDFGQPSPSEVSVAKYREFLAYNFDADSLPPNWEDTSSNALLIAILSARVQQAQLGGRVVNREHRVSCDERLDSQEQNLCLGLRDVGVITGDLALELEPRTPDQDAFTLVVQANEDLTIIPSRIESPSAAGGALSIPSFSTFPALAFRFGSAAAADDPRRGRKFIDFDVGEKIAATSDYIFYDAHDGGFLIYLQFADGDSEDRFFQLVDSIR